MRNTLKQRSRAVIMIVKFEPFSIREGHFQRLFFRYLWRMKTLTFVCCCVLILGACTFTLDQEKLVGSWDYVEIENLNPGSEDSTTLADLRKAKPYIQFSKDNQLNIFWEGKKLSSGTYRIDGKMIRYKEDLRDGGEREFPFLVSKLSENELVFETMTSEGTKVTAVKRK